MTESVINEEINEIKENGGAFSMEGITVFYDVTKEHLENSIVSNHGAWNIKIPSDNPSPSQRKALLSILKAIELNK